MIDINSCFHYTCNLINVIGKYQMNDNFIISIDHDTDSGYFTACFANGESVKLNADDYQDAVMEADLLDATEFQTA